MPTDKIKVAFLDRDGVINKEVNYLYKIEDFEYTENCIEGLKKIKEFAISISYLCKASSNMPGSGFLQRQLKDKCSTLPSS